MNWKKDQEAKLTEFRRQTRRSAEAFSDQALAFQLSLAIGGVYKEELEAEHNARFLGIPKPEIPTE
jgi:hypothetical protein